MNKKALFFDIDGTLIDHSRGIVEIPKGVQSELRRIQKEGHKIFISSGRPKAMLNDMILSAGFDGYVLANGGYVEVDGKSLYEDRMNYKMCKHTVEMLKELGCDYMIETANHIYLDNSHQELYHFFAKYNQGDIFIRDFHEDEVLKKAIKIEINVLDKDKEKVEQAIKNDFGYVIAYDQHGTDNAFELYSPTLSKAVGIQKVLDYYQIDKKDSYGFGDGTNDIDMIQYCGVGVAMGNAVQSLKDVADIVCQPIEEKGLEYILKKLF